MDHPTLPPIPERVTAGAALLDRAWPGWAGQVDPGRLDMAHTQHDLLGQLGGWSDACLRRLAPPASWPDTETWATWHGFDRGDHEPEAAYDSLTAAWRAELARRAGTDWLPQGPLEQAPGGRYLGEAGQRALLARVLAGIELGAYDRRILDWLASWDHPTVVTIASLLHRARAAGPEDPR